MDNNDFYDVSALETNQELEVSGVWRKLPHGAEVKVARWQNAEFTRLMRSKFKANRDLLEGEDELSDQIGNEVLIEVMACTILKDVKNMGLKGKRIEKYTPAIGMELLKIKDFRDKVKSLAEQMEAYQDKKEQAAVNF